MVLIKEYTYVCPASSSVVESCPTIVPCTAFSATILEDSMMSVGRSFTSVTYAKKNRNQLHSKLGIVRTNYLSKFSGGWGGGVTTLYAGMSTGFLPFFEQKINFWVSFLVKSQVILNFGVSF